MKPWTSPLFFALLLLVACHTNDDDDSARTIPPPEGCEFPALANTSFSFNIHYFEVDYPQHELVALMNEIGLDVFSFQFAPATVTELGPDPDSNGLAITLTDSTPPPEGEDPPEDPNWVRIVYELPLGYELPLELGDSIGSITMLDISQGSLIAAFGLWEETPEGEFELLFLAEPSDAGLAWQPGDTHPAFASVASRDRACPSLARLACANSYNLSVQFEVRTTLDEEGGEVPGDSFELWPTEHRDFTLGDLELRVVNVWSFAYRDIDPECSNPYDFSAERFSYFVTRSAAAPP